MLFGIKESMESIRVGYTLKGTKQPPKKGFSDNPRYITIETGIKPKPKCKYTKDEQHKYIHTLLLCYESQWHQLKFVKKRKHRKE